jgi:hypothetical protein
LKGGNNKTQSVKRIKLPHHISSTNKKSKNKWLLNI